MSRSARQAQLAAGTVNDQRWTAVVARDPSADGTFVYSVRTTGVYCRPSCSSRPARPENVQFHATSGDAVAAGFRPCKRCTPDQPSLVERRTATVTRACRRIEASDQALSLETLARAAGMSPFHFHRVFRALTGLTPRGYAIAHRDSRVRRQLERSNTVTQAIYESGYNSNGRFYAKSDAVLGMTPTAYRAGGATAEIRFAIGECSMGSILVARSDRGVCAILLGDDPEALARSIAALGNAENESWGIEFGYRYDGVEGDPVVYRPTTAPGARLPSVFLRDGSALYDRLGPWFTLLRFGDADPSALIDAAPVPIETVVVADPDVAPIYEAKLVLVRPDTHVAWRGNRCDDGHTVWQQVLS